jgi:DNA (cytosine-5)-methyltransferase 1
VSVSRCLDSSGGYATNQGGNVVLSPIAFSCKDHGADATEELAPTLRSMGHSTSHANAGGQVAVAFHENQRGEISLNDTVGALNKGGGKPGQGYPAVALNLRGREGGSQFEVSDVASLRAASGGSSRSYVVNGNSTPEVGDELAFPLRSNDGSGNRQALRSGMAVRRLTPIECEALQGFPPGYTQVPYRGKPAADGPRYKALGNSMAVPVMAWIGKRIDTVEFCFGEEDDLL